VRKQLDDLRETRGYWKLKDEALSRTAWRSGELAFEGVMEHS